MSTITVEYKDEKKEELKKEFEIIQNNITKWDNYSLSIKNWAITVWSAIMVFTVTQYYVLYNNGINLGALFSIPLLLPIPFWVFDGLAKYFQRISLIRSNAIQDYLNESIPDLSDDEKTNYDKTIEDFKNKKDVIMKENRTVDNCREEFINNFLIYDVVAAKSITEPFFIVKYYKKTGYLNCLLVRIVAFIYCVLSILTLVVIAIVTNYYWILCWVILYGNIIGLSWYYSNKFKL